MAELAEAIAPENSAWVSANAGSGKTHLLTNRVTRLLLAGVDPGRILCLTYTKAAAAEMSARLFTQLGAWALLPDDKLRLELAQIGATGISAESLTLARQLFAKALETPGGLKIQTIHSFCQRVLARFPVEASIPARFQVLDERSGAELMHEARIKVLERAFEGDPALAGAIDVIVTRAPDRGFAETLDQAIRDGRQLRRLIADKGGIEPFLSHLRRTLGVRPGEDENSALAKWSGEFIRDHHTINRVVAWLASGTPSDKEVGLRLTGFLEHGGAVESLRLLTALFFTEEMAPRKKLASVGLQRKDPALYATLEHWQQALVLVDERRKGATIARLTESIITVALAMLEEYAEAKRARAALDYDDLIARTLDLLERKDAAAWVLYKLDYGIEHILIDEAQDTSPEQWRIVAKLSEEFYAGSGVEGALPRTVFAVGDEKQSIFSFQGAAPEEFGRNLALFRERARGAQLAFSDVRPLVSRRSARAVLEFVDEVFTDERARNGLTAENIPVVHEAFRADIGRVEIWPTVKAPPGDSHDHWTRPVDAPSPKGAHFELAVRIADHIQEWLRNGTALPGSSTRIKPSDIMILVRRRGAFSEEMIRQLIDRRVPVAGADRMVLMDQIAIADLVAFGRFALLPDDDLNLAALLKSPIIGFDEDDLFVLAHGREGHLWRALNARAGARPIFAEALTTLSEALAKVDFVAPYEFYAQALSKGLRRKLVSRLGDEAADAIDEFLTLAMTHETRHPPSLESFLHWFQSGASEIKRDMEQGVGAVRVMTVHGAKGLEANIVILPDTTQIPDHERRAGLLYSEDCVYFGMAKKHETKPLTDAKILARAAEMREYRRLLYVALTRARDWLILCGFETAKGVHADSWYPPLQAAAEKIGRAEDGPHGTIFAVGLTMDGTSGRVMEPVAPAQIELPNIFFQAAVAPEVGKILRPFDATGMEEPEAASPILDSGHRFRRGLQIHALLALLPAFETQARRGIAASYLRQQGVAPEEQAKLIEEVLAVMEDQAFSELFGPASRGEVSISAPLPEIAEGLTIRGQIDRLAVSDTRVLIADFKTNRPAPLEISEIPALYRAQLALYRAALQKIYPGWKVSCALIWTEGPRLMELPDSLLDAEISRMREKNSRNTAS